MKRKQDEAEEKARLAAEKASKAKAEDAKTAELRARADKAKRDAEKLAAELKKLEQEQETASRKATETKAADDAKKQQESRKKLEAERARALLEGEDKPWMVQVSMATDQATADAMVAKLRAKGYKVRTSQTTKGVRVLVGPEKGKAAAQALKQQLSADPSLSIKGAWVSNWQPPTS